MTQFTKILFGVDGSDFSKTSLSAFGSMMSGDKNTKISIFHGAPDPCIILSKFPDLSPEEVEENLKRLNSESRSILEKAREVLLEAGVRKENVSTVFKEKCGDPAGAMIDFAEAEGFDVICMSRLGANTVGRHVIGSVSYRVACFSENLPVWIVDHRISSRNFLICLVGAPVGERVIDHVVNNFSFLEDTRFTLFHVIPSMNLQGDYIAQILSQCFSDEDKQKILENINIYLRNADKILEEGKRKLVAAGIPERNIEVKKKNQEQGMARDILSEMQKGDDGILVLGRKGSKNIQQFGLGSKAYKLLCTTRAFMVCLVN